MKLGIPLNYAPWYSRNCLIVSTTKYFAHFIYTSYNNCPSTELYAAFMSRIKTIRPLLNFLYIPIILSRHNSTWSRVERSSRNPHCCISKHSIFSLIKTSMKRSKIFPMFSKEKLGYNFGYPFCRLEQYSYCFSRLDL